MVLVEASSVMNQVSFRFLCFDGELIDCVDLPSNVPSSLYDLRTCIVHDIQRIRHFLGSDTFSDSECETLRL